MSEKEKKKRKRKKKEFYRRHSMYFTMVHPTRLCKSSIFPFRVCYANKAFFPPVYVWLEGNEKKEGLQEEEEKKSRRKSHMHRC